jgi:hypothetical protein
LPSNDKGDIHAHRDPLFRLSGIGEGIHRQRGGLINLFLFLENKEGYRDKGYWEEQNGNSV